MGFDFPELIPILSDSVSIFLPCYLTLFPTVICFILLFEFTYVKYHQRQLRAWMSHRFMFWNCFSANPSYTLFKISTAYRKFWSMSWSTVLSRVINLLFSRQHKIKIISRWVLFSLSYVMYITCKKDSDYEMWWVMIDAIMHSWTPFTKKVQRKSKAIFSFPKKPSQTSWLCMELRFHSSEEDMSLIGLEVNPTWGVTAVTLPSRKWIQWQ